MSLEGDVGDARKDGPSSALLDATGIGVKGLLQSMMPARSVVKGEPQWGKELSVSMDQSKGLEGGRWRDIYVSNLLPLSIHHTALNRA
jgi:hypothetical protein